MIEKYFVVGFASNLNGEVDKYFVCRRVAEVTANSLEESHDRLDDPPLPSDAFNFLDGWFKGKGPKWDAVEWKDNLTTAATTGNITNGGNIYKKQIPPPPPPPSP